MRASCLLFGFNILLVASFLGKANINAAKQSGEVHIVYMGSARKDHAQLVSRLLMKREKASLVHTYGKSFSGFAARLSDAEAESISRQPEVVSVFRDRASKLHTTHSWDFLISQNNQFSKNDATRSQPVSCSIGSNTIIGVIDTGIWPEHPSFDDKLIKDPIPTRWKGKCMPDNSSIPFKCNRKLIGARYYDNITARDDSDGHGTHVASTGAGSLVSGASYKGLAEGIARGGSPCSRIAAYSVCGPDGCYDSYILKAFDDAIDDGVDVLSVSLGGVSIAFLTDIIAIGAFHAVEKGIIVVSSVGNGGPTPGTLVNFAPWILSVGATTTDRVFEVSVVLGGQEKGVIYKGSGNFVGGLKKTEVYDLTDGLSAASDQTDDLDDAINCVPGSLDDAKVKGKIVLCGSSNNSYVHYMLSTLKKQGAAGIIYISNGFYNAPPDPPTDFTKYIPFVAVTQEDGAKITTYINTSSNPSASFMAAKTTLNQKPAPVVPYFSSRGPPVYDMENLIKPDVVAPGVNILAGVPPAGDEKADRQLFNIKSGTSMSSPHVSGLAAMLKSVHPTWSPSAIRSAIMTSAIHTDNLHSPIKTDEADGSVAATPYDMGSGEINPSNASLWPGLVYETSTADYVQFLCNMRYEAATIRVISSSTLPKSFSCPRNSKPALISDMNYPSISVSGLIANVGQRTVKRTVTNVGDARSTYTVTVVAPAGVQVEVVPNILRFTENVKTLTFKVSFKVTATSDEDMFGSITWSDGKNINVRSPFVVSTTDG